ncbi:hypothetical protein OAF16_02845 [Flavobacteriales bacterium]|nr:hypothetical protein [Flavobacteriales bacterium]
MNIRFLFILSLCVWSSIFYSQEKVNDKASFREKFEAANSLMEDNLFEFAKEIWLELVIEQPENSNVNYKTGYCLLKSANNKKEAFEYLNFAKSNIIERYSPLDYSVKGSPVEVLYYLGKSFHLNYEPDSAIKYFNQFIEVSSKNHFLKEMVFHDIKQCEIATKQLLKPKKYKLENIGGEINSSYSDFSPVITADESAIFFTSRRLRTDTNQVSNEGIYSPQDGKHFEDVYVSYKNFKTNKWDTPELADFNRPTSNQASVSVSADGQFLYFYKDDNQGNGDLYISERDDINYGSPRKLDAINSAAWETHVTTSIDGNTMYFVSDREGGYGGRDIYRLVKLPNGEWSQAYNIGPPINTPFDEDSPFLHPNGKTFYFSSNGEESMGGFDIFHSELNEDGKWTFPVNMGYPLNTVEDDLYFTTNADGKNGYYASSHEGGYGEKDIYKVLLEDKESEPLAILKGYIDPGTLDQIPAGIVIWVYDLTEGADNLLQYTPNRRNGSYVFNLIPCHEYLVEYTQNEEIFYSTEFKLPCEANYQEINKVITIGGIPLSEEDSTASGDQKNTITNNENNTTTSPEIDTKTETKSQNNQSTIAPVNFQIFYGYNEKGISSEQEKFNAFIDGINEIITINGKVQIELEGSASSVPTKSYNSNKNLANQRTINAKQFLSDRLVKLGVDISKFKIVSENSLVQGPKYIGDYVNKEKYAKYQYIKITAF